MPTLRLNILTIPTFDVNTLNIVDASTYPTNPPSVVNPTIEITPPGFNSAVLPFTVNDYNLFTSVNLGISENIEPLPDGVYFLKYSITPSYENYVEKSIMRVDRLQEKFDSAFMRLDMMECDRAIKKQSMVELDTIYYFIQGAIAAANNCAIVEANKLYNKADKLLNSFIKGDCGCSGNNYNYGSM